MRPEVRAEYARRLGRAGRGRGVPGPAGALLHRAARPAGRAVRRGRALPGAVRAAARRGRRVAAARAGRAARARPRARDHAGLAAARAGGGLRGLRRPLRRHAGRRARAPAVPARARRQLPAPDAAAARPARRPTTAATRWSTTARSSRRWARSTTCARWRTSCARTGWRCASTSCSTTRRPSTRGRAGAPATYYRTFPDRTEPDAYERTLPEVFPDIAPGNFTRVDGPLGVDDVQRLPVGPRLHQPGRCSWRWPRRCSASPSAGVDVLRLDAVPFLWKRLGTDCQNQPEVHDLLQAFRAAMRIAAPGGGVQGRGDRRAARPRPLPRHRPPRGQGVRPRLPQRAHGAAVERAGLGPGGAAHAHAARHAAACRPARAGSPTCAATTTSAGRSRPRTPPGRARTTHLHRRFLADFYAGEFPGTFARGARFQPDPATGEARTSGTAPRWPGWRARRRAWRVELAIRRVLLLHALAFAHGGLPLIYMGDELGLRNDPRWATTRRSATTTAGCTGRSWTGRRPSAGTTPRPSRAGCGPGCSG